MIDVGQVNETQNDVTYKPRCLLTYVPNVLQFLATVVGFLFAILFALVTIRVILLFHICQLFFHFIVKESVQIPRKNGAIHTSTEQSMAAVPLDIDQTFLRRRHIEGVRQFFKFFVGNIMEHNRPITKTDSYCMFRLHRAVLNCKDRAFAWHPPFLRLNAMHVWPIVNPECLAVHLIQQHLVQLLNVVDFLDGVVVDDFVFDVKVLPILFLGIVPCFHRRFNFVLYQKSCELIKHNGFLPFFVCSEEQIHDALFKVVCVTDGRYVVALVLAALAHDIRNDPYELLTVNCMLWVLLKPL